MTLDQRCGTEQICSGAGVHEARVASAAPERQAGRQRHRWLAWPAGHRRDWQRGERRNRLLVCRVHRVRSRRQRCRRRRAACRSVCRSAEAAARYSYRPAVGALQSPFPFRFPSPVRVRVRVCVALRLVGSALVAVLLLTRDRHGLCTQEAFAQLHETRRRTDVGAGARVPSTRE